MPTELESPQIAPSFRLRSIIILVSVLVPVLVAVLIFLPGSARIQDLDVRFLPHLNAILNSATAVALVGSLISILNKKRETHKLFNYIALALGALFLVSYVVYHYADPGTKYGDLNHDQMVDAAEKAAAGSARTVYLILLATHIVLAAGVLPFVLFSFYYGLTNQLKKHRRLSWFTWPIWLYVSVSGVVVYWMISPYYK